MVTITVEPLSYMILNGVINLSMEHREEMEAEYRHIPYSPDWETYQEMEDKNCLRCFALRESGNLIGYAAVVLDKDVHRSGVLFADFRDIFITKKKRGYAAKFLNHIEKIIKPLGVQREYISERLISGSAVGGFLKAMGFEPQETIWGKTLH